MKSITTKAALTTRSNVRNARPAQQAIFENSIIETRLRPPQVVTGAVERDPELQKLLVAAENGYVATIVAPAGSGKSTLMKQHFDQLEVAGFSNHWISLDRTNDEPLDFVRHLFKALESLAPAQVESQLTQIRASHSEGMTTAFDLVTRFITGRSRPVAILLDDFHVISSTDIHTALGKLLAYLPSNVHVVFGSRSRIPIDLSRRRLSGMLVELNADDLNLNAAETERLLARAHDLQLQHEDLDQLHAITEGWLAGVQLAALRIKQAPIEARQIIREFSEHDQNLKDYLFRSVFDQLSSAAQDFLLATAPLHKLNADLCDVVRQRSDSTALLDQLEQRNLFLIPLDNRRQWFRYHHLMSDFLLQEFNRRNASELNRIREIAARWCVSHDMLTDAIQYLLEAEAFDDAAALINASVTRIALEDGDHATVLDWMRRLPRSIHDSSPQLLLNHAWSRAFSRDAKMAQDLCEAAVCLLQSSDVHKRLSVEEREQLKWYGQLVDGLSVAAMDRTRSAIPILESLSARIPESESVLQASISNTLSYCNLSHGQLEQAVRLSAEAYRLAQSGETAYSVTWSQFLAGTCGIEVGRLGAAEEAVDTAKRYLHANQPDGLYTRALVQLLSADLAVNRCDFAQAGEVLSNGNVFSTIYGPTDVLVRAYSTAARQLAWRGATGQARQELLHAQDIALATNQQRMYLMLAAEEAALQFQLGDPSAAEDTLRRTDLLELDLDATTREHANSIQEARRLIQARLMLANNQSVPAQSSLYGLARTAEREGRTWKLAQVRALRSIAFWQTGKSMDAVRELLRAINTVASEGMLYPILSAGLSLIPILREIEDQWERVAHIESRQAPKREIVTCLLRLFAGDTLCSKSDSQTAMKDRSPPNFTPNFDLTSREVELLGLIASGLSNKELAAEAFITVSTAKWHVQNIFEKLGVRNRTAAVALARKAQLVP